MLDLMCKNVQNKEWQYTIYSKICLLFSCSHHILFYITERLIIDTHSTDERLVALSACSSCDYTGPTATLSTTTPARLHFLQGSAAYVAVMSERREEGRRSQTVQLGGRNNRGPFTYAHNSRAISYSFNTSSRLGVPRKESLPSGHDSLIHHLCCTLIRSRFISWYFHFVNCISSSTQSAACQVYKYFIFPPSLLLTLFFWSLQQRAGCPIDLVWPHRSPVRAGRSSSQQGLMMRAFVARGN